MSITKFGSILVTMDLLTQLNLEDPTSEYDLYNMGWRGPMEGEVFEFYDYYVGCKWAR